MSEKLLIRRSAPFIPSLHISNGIYGIKGHCVSFPQDISDMCDELPRRRDSIITFVRQMGNKSTSEMYLKHLRVNKEKIISALKWLKIHHSGYHDITIKKDNLDWMKGKKQSSLVAGLPHVELTEEKIGDNRQYCSEVQCSGDNEKDSGFQFTTTALNKSTMPQTDEQLKPLDELKSVLKETNQIEKLMFFPPHGDKPVK